MNARVRRRARATGGSTTGGAARSRRDRTFREISRCVSDWTRARWRGGRGGARTRREDVRDGARTDSRAQTRRSDARASRGAAVASRHVRKFERFVRVVARQRALGGRTHRATEHQLGLVTNARLHELLAGERVGQLEVERAVLSLHHRVQAVRGDVRQRDEHAIVGQASVERSVIATPAVAATPGSLELPRHLGELSCHLTRGRHLDPSPARGTGGMRRGWLRGGAEVSSKCVIIIPSSQPAGRGAVARPSLLGPRLGFAGESA